MFKGLAGLIASAVWALPAQAAGPEKVAIGDTFAIDRTEVTIEDFRRFASAKQFKTAAEREGGGFEFGKGWERRPGWTVYRPFADEPESGREPAVHVSWEEAHAYCQWRAGRLPTAEEWTRAAYHEMRPMPSDGFETGVTYRYPTGNEPRGMNTSSADSWPRHAPVGSTAPGVNGLYDMGGNVWEWLADRDGDNALTAGGSWWYGADKTTIAAMQYKPADFYAVYVGFRCVNAHR